MYDDTECVIVTGGDCGTVRQFNARLTTYKSPSTIILYNHNVSRFENMPQTLLRTGALRAIAREESTDVNVMARCPKCQEWQSGGFIS